MAFHNKDKLEVLWQCVQVSSLQVVPIYDRSTNSFATVLDLDLRF